MQGRRNTKQGATGVWSELLEQDRENAARTVPHFLYQHSAAATGTQAVIADGADRPWPNARQVPGEPFARTTSEGAFTTDMDQFIGRQDHQPSRHAPPSWAKDFYDSESKPIIRGLAIAAVLVLASGVGLGVVAFQLSDRDQLAKQVVASTLAAAPKPATPQVRQPTVAEIVPSQQVISRKNKSVPTPQSQTAAQAMPTAVAPPSNLGSGNPPALPVAAGGPETITPQRVVIEPAALPIKTSTRSEQPAAVQPPMPASENALFMRQRGDDVLQLGDVAGARAFYRKALQLGDVASAGRIGRTYDPIVFTTIGVRGMLPNPRMAERWYRHAVNAGDVTAGSDLEKLIEYVKE